MISLFDFLIGLFDGETDDEIWEEEELIAILEEEEEL